MDEIVNLLNFTEDSIENAKISIKKECPICYEIIGEKNNCNTSCGHSFCFSCITKALSKNNTCPCCRENLVDQNIYESSLNTSNIIIFHEEDNDEEIEEEESPIEQFIYDITYDFKSFRLYIINEIIKYFDSLDSTKIKKFKNCNLKIFSKIYIKEFRITGISTTKYNKNNMKKIYDIFFNNSKDIVDFVDYNKYLSDEFIKQKKLKEKKLQKKIKSNKISNKPYFRI